jgi:protein-tyrosine phosphatase
MKHHLERSALAGACHVDSAGIGGWHAGELADKRMREHATRRGYSLTSRARQFDPTTDFPAFDLIIGMDASNLRDLREMAPTREAREKIHGMASYGHDPLVREVPDPYFGGPDGFERVLDILEDATRGLLETLLA